MIHLPLWRKIWIPLHIILSELLWMNSLPVAGEAALQYCLVIDLPYWEWYLQDSPSHKYPSQPRITTKTLAWVINQCGIESWRNEFCQNNSMCELLRISSWKSRRLLTRRKKSNPWPGSFYYNWFKIWRKESNKRMLCTNLCCTTPHNEKLDLEAITVAQYCSINGIWNASSFTGNRFYRNNSN